MESPSMPHRILPFLDSHNGDHILAMIGCLMTTMLGYVMMGISAINDAETDEIRLLLMPLIGAMVSTIGAYLLSPKENPRNLAGRSIFSVALGTVVPVVFGYISEYGANMARHPTALFVMGMVVATIVFILIKPIIDRIYGSAPVIAKSVVDKALNNAHISCDTESGEQNADPTSVRPSKKRNKQ